MPIQINEVIIRAVVDAPSTNATSPASTASQPMGGNATEANVLEMVLEILREKNER